jgi:EmrB/QacA subfamily drug resistance transporter
MSKLPPPRILVPLIVACALFMENLDATVLSTALPAIALDLHESPIQLKLALTSYLLTLAVFIPASGWLADRFGTRMIFRIAVAIFAFGSAMCGFSTTIGWLVASRALQGIGGAMMVPVGRLVILRTVPKSELVGALAWLTMPALIGPILGPPLGGFITTYFSWRWIFWINLPVAALGLVLATLFIPDVRGETKSRFDFLGFILSGVGLATFVSGSAAFGANALPPAFGLSLLVVGVAVLFLYVLHARRSVAPILDLNLLRLPTFRASVVGGSLFRIGIGATPFLLPLLLQLGFGMSPLKSGLLTFITAIGAFGMKTAAGSILRWLGFRTTLLVNTVIAAFLTAAPAFFTIKTPEVLMLLVLFLAGFFRSLQFTCINSIGYAEIEQSEMSQATSFSSVMQQLSLSIGVTVGASILEITLAIHGHANLQATDFLPAFLIVGFLTFLSFFSFRTLSKDAGAEVAGRPRPTAPADAHMPTASEPS